MGGQMAISAKVLTVLQFTRAALVFTAVADVLAAVLLTTTLPRAGGVAGWGGVNAAVLVFAVAMSCCLYGFGMALNDLVDRRRDALLAATRPLPSGRLGLTTAHWIVAVLGVMSLVFAGALAGVQGGRTGTGSFVLAVMTLGLINFYNLAGKYLVSAGLLALGAVRLVHAMIAAPELPVVWHPLWLFTHVVVVSAVAYVWEEKRPRITPVHAAVLSLGVVAINVGVVAIAIAWKLPTGASLREIPVVLAVSPALAIPFVSSFAFAVVAWRIGRSVGPANATKSVGATAVSGAPAPGATSVVGEEPDVDTLPLPLRTRRRQAGRQLILAGLLWLIVHDAAFVTGYVGWAEGISLLVLLPLAYGAVRLMRVWGDLMRLKDRPQFRVAERL